MIRRLAGDQQVVRDDPAVAPTPKQKDMLDTVIDAGSAAAHRGFKPNRSLLQEMVITMETIIRDPTSPDRC
jgi:hypothetical protein